MEWYEDPDRRLFAETAAKYAEWTGRELEPESRHQRVRPEGFNRELVRQAALAGLISGPLPLDLGGAELDRLGRMMVLERVAQGTASAAYVLAVHWAGLLALTAGNGERGWVQELADRAASERPWLCGVLLPAAAVEGAKDLAAAREEDGGVRLSGEFLALIHPEITERAVIVAAPAGGEEVLGWLPAPELAPHCREAYPGTGLAEVPLARLTLPGLLAPKLAAVTAPELRRELWLALAAVMAGNAEAARCYAHDYARERVQTGRPIIEHQDVRRMLLDMKTHTEAARAAAYAAAALNDGDDAAGRARRAFGFAGTALEQVNLDAVQVLGGYGYMKDYGLERRLRDVKTLQCVVGS